MKKILVSFALFTMAVGFTAFTVMNEKDPGYAKGALLSSTEIELSATTVAPGTTMETTMEPVFTISNDQAIVYTEKGLVKTTDGVLLAVTQKVKAPLYANEKGETICPEFDKHFGQSKIWTDAKNAFTPSFKSNPIAGLPKITDYIQTNILSQKHVAKFSSTTGYIERIDLTNGYAVIATSKGLAYASLSSLTAKTIKSMVESTNRYVTFNKLYNFKTNTYPVSRTASVILPKFKFEVIGVTLLAQAQTPQKAVKKKK